MIQRFLSTTGLWAIIILSLVLFGHLAGLILVVLLTLLSQNELYSLLHRFGHPSNRRTGLFIGVLVVISAYYTPEVPILFLAILLSCAMVLTAGNKLNAFSRAIATLFGILYVPFLLKFLILTLHHLAVSEQAGVLLAVWIIVAAKFTDVGGLLVGSMIGRHKLARAVSPHKTWEGAIGGLLLAAAVTALFVWAFRLYLPPSFNLWKAVVAVIPLSAVAILSDLVESIIKRLSGQKDSARLIPGIGGALDLVDSILFCSPLGYLILKYIVID